MKIEFEGRVYDYSLDDLDVEQSLRIEKHIKAAGVGETLLDWENGLRKASTPCLQALGWMILHGGDVTVPIASVNFKVMKLGMAWIAALEAEGSATEDEADPTKPDGSSTPPTPGSTPSATGQPVSAGPFTASSTGSGLTG